MAEESFQTVGDLRRKATVTDEEISAAVDAFIEDSTLNAFRFASGHVLDVKAAVDDHAPAKAALAVAGTSFAFRRTMIWRAVIMAVLSAP